MTPFARAMRTAPGLRVEPASESQRVIPFDQTFRFELTGVPDTSHRAVTTVSVEASFTAVSIGYGVIPRVTPIVFGPVAITVNPPTLPAGVVGDPYSQTITQTGGVAPATFSLIAGAAPAGLTLSPQGVLSGTPTTVGVSLFTVRATDAEGSFGERAYALEITTAPIPILLAGSAASAPISQSLRDISVSNLLNGLQRALADTPDPFRGETGPEAAFKGGIKLNPQFAELALLNNGQSVVSDRETLQRLFQVVSAPSDEVQFLYALFDDGSGREFQSEPLLNTAGLGSSDGDRPFRYFARPITFEPRSVIRMEITEKSDFQGELHVSLHGYKALGSPGTPTGKPQTARGRPRRR
ncbi:MAG TPA: Ig domain-containing protein [Blastocatellia bacterium]|nr:Ig domain-containing protein [Blastocatellia bacterium]